MSEKTPDSVEYEMYADLQKRSEAQKQLLTDGGRLFSVTCTSALNAAQSIQTAMCLFDKDHAAQRYLNEALHSVLIAAEQCRQAHDKGIR